MHISNFIFFPFLLQEKVNQPLLAFTLFLKALHKCYSLHLFFFKEANCHVAIPLWKIDTTTLHLLPGQWTDNTIVSELICRAVAEMLAFWDMHILIAWINPLEFLFSWNLYTFIKSLNSFYLDLGFYMIGLCQLFLRVFYLYLLFCFYIRYHCPE